MQVRAVQSALILAALALPAAALAEALPPHSSYYSEHTKYTKPENNVSMLINRKTGHADVYVQNFCLGSMNSYPLEAITRSAHAHNGALGFDGKAVVYTQTGSSSVSMKVSASVTPEKVTGTVKFPQTAACKPISFTAKLGSSTK